MRFLLVTGGLGYLGAQLVVEFMRASHIPVILDEFGDVQVKHLGIIKDLTGFNPVVFQGSLLNKRLLNRIFSEFQIDSVYHLGLKGHDDAYLQPYGIITNNVSGTKCLLDSMQRFGINNLIHVTPRRDYLEIRTESELPKSINPYVQSNLLIDKLVTEWGHLHENNYTTLKLYKPMGFTHQGAFIDTSYESTGDSFYSLCNLMLNKAIEPHFVNYKELTRDYVHVSDILRVMIKALLETEKGKSGTYNVGRGIGVTPKDLSDMYQEISNMELVKTPLFDNNLGQSHFVSSDGLPFELEAEFFIRDALEEALRWYPVCG